MLVLTRRVDERIVIFTNPPIVLTLVELPRGNLKARIGFEAHRSVEILREERLTPEQMKLIEQAVGRKEPPVVKNHAGQVKS